MNTKVKAAYPLTKQRFKVRTVTQHHGFDQPTTYYAVLDLEEHYRVAKFKRHWVAVLFTFWLEMGRQANHLDWV